MLIYKEFMKNAKMIKKRIAFVKLLIFRLMFSGGRERVYWEGMGEEKIAKRHILRNILFFYIVFK